MTLNFPDPNSTLNNNFGQWWTERKVFLCGFAGVDGS